MGELLDRKAEIDRGRRLPVVQYDEKERKEREEAAQRYAGENEQHFSDYALDCVGQTTESLSPVRRVQAFCWSVFQEEEPPTFAEKEEWQAKLVVPKPFQTVMFGAASIKKAFSPDFLSVENWQDEASGQFWRKMLEAHFDRSHADFLTRFQDATQMGLAVGTSMEAIPRWAPGKGLEIDLVEPWKILRDPDALPRQPHSGLYWIHSEWLDFHVLKQGEKDGKYVNVDRVKDAGTVSREDPWMTQERVEARKQMLRRRGNFRQSTLTREVWGTVLSPQGEILAENMRYTLGADRVIERPRIPQGGYRWPGTSYSPLPHLLRYDGRGLLNGVAKLWIAMCDILCMHMDFMQWIVNPPSEVNLDALDDPDDADVYPGVRILTRNTQHGQQALRVEQRRSRTNDVLANLQQIDQMYQRGSFVSDQVQGLPGYRSEITYREAAMQLDQALTVFGLMGFAAEVGAVQMITQCALVIRENANYEDYRQVFTEEELKEHGVEPDPAAPNGVRGVPPIDGRFHVSGLEALMKENEVLKSIREIVLPLSDHPRYAKYIDPYRVVRAIEVRTNLTDEGIFYEEKEARLLEKQERLQAAKQAEAVERMEQLREALGVAELLDKIKEIEAKVGDDVPALAQGLLQLGGGQPPSGGGGEPGA